MRCEIEDDVNRRLLDERIYCIRETQLVKIKLRCSLYMTIGIRMMKIKKEVRGTSIIKILMTISF